MLPTAARSWYLPEPGGRPLPRLPSEKTGDIGEPEVGVSARAMPSGPYFLGLPLFFLPKRSPPLLPPLPPPLLPVTPMARPAPSSGDTAISVTPLNTLGNASGCSDGVGDGDGGKKAGNSFSPPPPPPPPSPSHPDTTMLSPPSMHASVSGSLAFPLPALFLTFPPTLLLLLFETTFVCAAPQVTTTPQPQLELSRKRLRWGNLSGDRME
ncbi:hypothetical protein BHE74_00002660 [Ensete ventricosum]|nr:hypothetical protein BHE74_00002660 [Ensete ventricosum]